MSTVPIAESPPSPAGLSRATLLRLTGLHRLSASQADRPGITIALIDGPLDIDHPSLRGAAISRVNMTNGQADRAAAAHATFVASMLVGAGDAALGLCRGCPLVAIGAVDEAVLAGRISIPAIAARIAEALRRALRDGAEVVLLPLDVTPGVDGLWQPLIEAIGDAARRGVRVVIPAGNLSGPVSGVLAAPGVIPIVGRGNASTTHRWGAPVARRGLAAPAWGIPGAALDGGYAVRAGASFAAAFAAAAFALLKSFRPAAAREAVWWSLLDPASPERAFGRVPELDAGRSLERLATIC